MSTGPLEAGVAALQALDAETLVQLYVDGFVFEDVAAGETITSREGLFGYFKALFSAPDVGFSDVGTFECGDKGAAEWIWSGTNRRGEAFSVKGVSIFEFAAAGIKRETIFYDPRPALS